MKDEVEMSCDTFHYLRARRCSFDVTGQCDWIVGMRRNAERRLVAKREREIRRTTTTTTTMAVLQLWV
jgi:hypothetical protein